MLRHVKFAPFTTCKLCSRDWVIHAATVVWNWFALSLFRANIPVYVCFFSPISCCLQIIIVGHGMLLSFVCLFLSCSVHLCLLMSNICYVFCRCWTSSCRPSRCNYPFVSTVCWARCVFIHKTWVCSSLSDRFLDKALDLSWFHLHSLQLTLWFPLCWAAIKREQMHIQSYLHFDNFFSS